MIKKISFEIETITPMFLSGADQNKAELRAASIKGLLRFWWRALQSESDINELRKREFKIFGSADEKLGGGAGFSIRVNQPDRQSLPDFKNEIAGRTGISYLFYSASLKGRQRPYFPAASRFRITFAAIEEEPLKSAAASLWALVYLGGIGSRARRGGGNIVVTEVADEQGILDGSGLDFIPECDNAHELFRWLMENLKSARNILTGDKGGFVAEYSNLSICRCIVGSKSSSTWISALNEPGTIFKKFRDNNNSRIFESGAFGLPIMHRKSHTTVKGRVGRDSVNRRSSPLIFKLIKVSGKYYWIVLRLAGEFFPEDGVVTANNKSEKPGYGIIDEVWTGFKEKGREGVLSMPPMLESITNSIKNEINPQKIILFGSKARGDFHSRSDIDIAVETDSSLGEISLSGPVDIVDLKHADNELKQKIKKEGVTVYER